MVEDNTLCLGVEEYSPCLVVREQSPCPSCKKRRKEWLGG